MPRNTTLDLVANTWTELTNADATAITFQNQGVRPVLLKGTVGAVAPTDTLGALEYPPTFGEVSVLTLAEAWPGVASTRVYAISYGTGKVTISHA